MLYRGGERAEIIEMLGKNSQKMQTKVGVTMLQNLAVPISVPSSISTGQTAAAAQRSTNI